MPRRPPRAAQRQRRNQQLSLGHEYKGFQSLFRTLAVGYLLQRFFKKQLLPLAGRPVPWHNRAEFASADLSDDSLQLKHGRTQRIYEREVEGKEPLLKGAETVIVGKDENLYLFTEDAKLITMKNFAEAEDGITVMADVDLVKDLGVGRPLGANFSPDGKTLWIADAILGLTRLRNPLDPKSKVELIADSVMHNGNMTQMLYVNDVCVGPKSGKVYFTDSSDIAPDRIGTETWDTLYASKLDLLRAVPTGRLLEYDPHTDTVKVLADGFKFANGIAVDPNESFVFFAETFGIRLWKYYLTGEKAGQVEVVLDSKDATGYFDGVDCSSSKGGKCYSVMPSTIVPIHKLCSKVPDFVDIIMRNVFMALPRSLAPKVSKVGALVVVDPITKEFHYLYDPMGEDLGMLNGVREHKGKLYLGSLKNNFIAVYKLTKED